MDAKETPSTLGDYVGVLNRRRVYLLTIIPVSLLLAVYIAYALTPVYRASATIMLDPASLSSELVQTLSSYADSQFELVQRQVLVPDNLTPLVKEIDPYPEMKDLSAREKAEAVINDTLIERVDPVTFEVLQQSSAFSIHYHNPDPERAAAIAQQLSTLFLKYNRETRTERAAAAYEFLLKQSQYVEVRMAEVDKKVAAFKLSHPGAMPDAQEYNQNAADRASQYLFDIDGQIRRAEERRGLLEVQLSKLSPTLGSTTGNTATDLATLQGQLAEARIRYTPDHPDVKRLQRLIQDLAAKAESEPGGGAVVPNNPDYIGIKGQLDSVEGEIEALKSSAARERSRIYTFESGTAAAPNVEREFAELVRSKDVLQRQFDDLHARLREADISRSLESEQRGDRFSQIKAPRIPEAPYSPNRLGIILLGLLLGTALAMGLAALAESSDPSVRSNRDLLEITSIPAIASVPVMLNEAERRQQWHMRVAYVAVLAVMTAAVAITVVAT